MSRWIRQWRKCRKADQSLLPELALPEVEPLFLRTTKLAPALYRLEAEGQSDARHQHALHVATYMIHLAICHGEDPVRFAEAGLLHDLAKERPAREQAELSRRDPLCPSSMTGGSLHGSAAVTLLKDGGPPLSEEAYEAIRLHTVAKPNFSRLGMALYIADKVELTRGYGDLEPIREAAKFSLEEAMALCLREVIESLERSHIQGHPWTWEALHYYES